MGNMINGLRDDQQLNVKELKETLEKEEVLLIDVRGSSERKHGAIQPSIHIPLETELNLSQEDFKSKYGKEKPSLDDGRKIVFYCQHGFRGASAVKRAFQNYGFHSQNLTGGYSQW